MKPPTQENTQNCFIKPSQSLTSLPPPNSGSSELIQAKLRLERPYNSLKKKRNSERDIFRRSWGESVHSHSSCSLQSNATNNGSGTGKDDFWAALSTNYHFIMDTNLLDSCREAKTELEEGVVPELKIHDSSCEKSLSPSSRSQGSLDPRTLRRWLREMESRIENSPITSLSESMKMKTSELQKRLADHSDLYREIVSQQRTVGACIREFEKAEERKEKESKSLSPTGRKSDSSVKGLERRYHLLYLKAIEIQCLLESFIARRRSPSPELFSTDTDDEPATKLAKLSDTEGDYSSGRGVSDISRLNCSEECPDSENLKSDLDCNDNDDDVDYDDNDDQVWKPKYLGEHCLGQNTVQHEDGSDADSEGSDCDIIPIIHNNTNGSAGLFGSQTTSSPPLKPISPPICHQNMDTSYNHEENNKSSLNTTLSSTASLGYSPKIIDTVIKRPKQIDISKFNRSNRKSKNCAIFYFKHLDTDSENNRDGEEEEDEVDGTGVNKEEGEEEEDDDEDDEEVDEGDIEGDVELIDCVGGDNNNYKSSQDSEGGLLISENQSSDDEWFYTNEKGKPMLKPKSIDFFSHNNSDANNDNDLAMEDKTITIVEDKIIESIDLPNGHTNNNKINKSLIKKNKNNINGKMAIETTSSSSKSYQTQYSKESIKQLVLGAETLVREEVKFKSTGKSPKKLNKKFSELFIVSTSNSSNSNSFSVNNNINNNINNNNNNNKCDKSMSNPKIIRVQEWLEHQPLNNEIIPSAPTTDCDASGEYTTESDSAARDSDTSEGMADSIATCLQGNGSNSQATSCEIIGGSAEPLLESGGGRGNTEMDGARPIGGCNGIKVTMRTNRRNSERPWSVSCLSQLTQNTNVSKSNDNVMTNQGLANFSISESALDTLSSPNKPITPKHHQQQQQQQREATIKNSDSKNSLKKRRSKLRKRSTNNIQRKSESGSDGQTLPQYELPTVKLLNPKSLIKSESFSGQSTLAQDLNSALSGLATAVPKIGVVGMAGNGKEITDSEDDTNRLMKPNFCLGAYTNVLVPGGVSNLGSLAALANYNHDEKLELLEAEQNQTGTEDHSSFSEQAWDNYQEKYQSEPYSEGFDSDAARRLLEFGDDYRNYLDSQSDCCSSSLSAANNMDSLSPPRNRKFIHGPIDEPKHLLKLNLNGISSGEPSINNSGSNSHENSLRRRRMLDYEQEKKRKNSNSSRKISSDERRRSCESSASNKGHSPNGGSKLINSSSRSNGSSDYLNNRYDPNGTPSTINTLKGRRKMSESDQHAANRRRSVRSIDKLAIKNSFSSSSSSDSEDDVEVRNLLQQSKNRLEHTEALRIRRHLLRPEDYAEIIATCRDNVRCLESVLRGAPGTVLTTQRCQETRELLSSWESLLSWSENASVARQLQEEMTMLKSSLLRLGTDELNPFDTEDSILYAVEELKKEKLILQTHRSTMLRLNASVHSWLMRQEMKMNKILEDCKFQDNTLNSSPNQGGSAIQAPGGNAVGGTVSDTMNEKGEQFEKHFIDEELHKYLKNEVGDMYSAWDEADARITNRLENLTTSHLAWKQFESGLSEFQESLDKDKGALTELKCELERGERLSKNFAQDVKDVVKLLSEKSIETNIQTQLSPNENNHHHNLHPNNNSLAFINIKSSSNGSLSDSGISDGGCVSDGGLSERERRLGALRRLARQLENALAPGSEALKSISQRMEAAETELRDLQNTCRELIVRTTTTKPQNAMNGADGGAKQPNGGKMMPTAITPPLSPTSGAGGGGGGGGGKGRNKRSPKSKRRNSNGNSKTQTIVGTGGYTKNGNSLDTNRRNSNNNSPQAAKSKYISEHSDPDDPDDDPSGSDMEMQSTSGKNSWVKRVVRLAVPVQIAIVTLFCAACLMEPNCCDTLNNFSMSFSPQLRYIRGPPPI